MSQFDGIYVSHGTMVISIQIIIHVNISQKIGPDSMINVYLVTEWFILYMVHMTQLVVIVLPLSTDAVSHGSQSYTNIVEVCVVSCKCPIFIFMCRSRNFSPGVWDRLWGIRWYLIKLRKVRSKFSELASNTFIFHQTIKINKVEFWGVGGGG